MPLNFPNQRADGATAYVLPLPNKQIIAGCYASILEGDNTTPSKAQYKVFRLNENGTYDNTFGINGFASIDLGPRQFLNVENYGRRLALQADGKIVGSLTGYNSEFQLTEMVVFRLKSNGIIDSSFSGDGIVHLFFDGSQSGSRGLALQQDGKILVAGYYHQGGFMSFAIVRLLPDGTPDATFNSTGVKLFKLGTNHDTPNAILQQPDGKILIGASSFISGSISMLAIRLNSNGSLDGNFNGLGWKSVAFDGNTTNDRTDMILQPDGKILMAGSSNYSPYPAFAVARLNTNGSFDNSFDGDGRNTVNFGAGSSMALSVALQQNGKILLAGRSEVVTGNIEATLARFDANGKLDSTFNTNGRKIFNASPQFDMAASMAVLPNGKLLLGITKSSIPTVLQTGNVTADCNNVDIKGAHLELWVSKLGEAPIASVQVFNSSWSSVYQQTFNNYMDTVRIPLPPGQYFVKVNFYNSDWSSICEKSGFYTVTGTVLPVASIGDVTVNESAGVANVQICLNTPSSKQVTVNYRMGNGTATPRSDYDDTPSSVVIPAGQTCVNAPVNIINDAIQEPTETFGVSIYGLTDATFGDTLGIVTILDDDSAGAPDCSKISITPASSSIKLGGLVAPVVTVQVFTSGWQNAFNQTYTNSPDSIVVPNLGAQTYHVTVRFYTSSWSLICERSADVPVIPGESCPPGVICVHNACPGAGGVSLDTVYRIPVLPPGTSITWHTATPASPANQMTPQQISTPVYGGTYYVALYNASSNCYSNTLEVRVTTFLCSSAVKSAYVESVMAKLEKKSPAGELQPTVVPNPFASFVTVNIPSTASEKATVSLLDFEGRQLLTKSVQLQKGNNKVVMDGLGSYPSGTYLLRVSTPQQTVNFKIVRQQ